MSFLCIWVWYNINTTKLSQHCFANCSKVWFGYKRYLNKKKRNKFIIIYLFIIVIVVLTVTIAMYTAVFVMFTMKHVTVGLRNTSCNGKNSFDDTPGLAPLMNVLF